MTFRKTFFRVFDFRSIRVIFSGGNALKGQRPVDTAASVALAAFVVPESKSVFIPQKDALELQAEFLKHELAKGTAKCISFAEAMPDRLIAFDRSYKGKQIGMIVDRGHKKELTLKLVEPGRRKPRYLKRRFNGSRRIYVNNTSAA